MLNFLQAYDKLGNFWFLKASSDFRAVEKPSYRLQYLHALKHLKSPKFEHVNELFVLHFSLRTSEACAASSIQLQYANVSRVYTQGCEFQDVSCYVSHIPCHDFEPEAQHVSCLQIIMLHTPLPLLAPHHGGSLCPIPACHAASQQALSLLMRMCTCVQAVSRSRDLAALLSILSSCSYRYHMAKANGPCVFAIA